MTKCNVSIPFFQGPKSRKIEFNFSGGDISSDGGLLFVKEFDRKLQALYVDSKMESIVVLA